LIHSAATPIASMTRNSSSSTPDAHPKWRDSSPVECRGPSETYWDSDLNRSTTRFREGECSVSCSSRVIDPTRSNHRVRASINSIVQPSNRDNNKTFMRVENIYEDINKIWNISRRMCLMSVYRMVNILLTLRSRARIDAGVSRRVASPRGQGQPLVESWQASMWLVTLDRIPCQNFTRLRPLSHRQWPLKAHARYVWHYIGDLIR